MRGRIFWALSGVAVVMWMASFFGPGVAVAQTDDGGWSPPVLLFKIPDGAKVFFLTPIVVAGEDGGVHVFWQYQVPQIGSEPPHDAIYYTRWDGEAWSRPVDIVSAPTARLSSATIDSNGYLHLLWQGGLGHLYYSRAWGGDATSAGKWMRPVAVDAGYLNGQVVADSRGWLHRVYAKPGHLGPYYQVSTDGGATWSFPANVARTTSDQAGADWVRLAVSDNGTLHVVWTEFALPAGWPPTGVFYARSEDGGRTWSPPIELAGHDDDEINVAVSGASVVHVAWNGDASVASRYHRWSADGGKTWSATTTVVQGGGTEGPPQLAVDSAGTLHMVTTSGSRVWYDSWRDGKWTAPQYVPSGDEANIPAGTKTIDYSTRHIEQASMAIGTGNHLCVVFWDQRVQENVTYVWYTMKTVAAPPIRPVQFPTPTTAAAGSQGSSTGSSFLKSARWVRESSAVVGRSQGPLNAAPDPVSAASPSVSRLPALAASGLVTLLVVGVTFLSVVRRRSG